MVRVGLQQRGRVVWVVLQVDAIVRLVQRLLVLQEPVGEVLPLPELRNASASVSISFVLGLGQLWTAIVKVHGHSPKLYACLQGYEFKCNLLLSISAFICKPITAD